MPLNPVPIGPYRCGRGQPLLLIAGPCVIEDPVRNKHFTLSIAQRLREITDGLPVQLVFKASFDKANRTSMTSYRGPGLQEGCRILEEIRRETGLPVVTDIHEPSQASPVAEVCDLLQIPAFLARQTDLLVAAARTGKPVNVKKGQFMAPDDMRHVLGKLEANHCDRVLLCERGTFFGYGRLVCDMGGLARMRQLGCPVIFDATHSVQEPGGLDGTTGGKRELVEPLARAATAVGVDGLFFETHPNPDEAKSDGPNMVPLEAFEAMLRRLLDIRAVVFQQETTEMHSAGE